MENFKELKTRLIESKDRLIDKMKNLTDEQKQTAKDFFNKYPSFEREIDWNRVNSKNNPLTWDDLKAVITKDRTYTSRSQTKKAIRKGLEGFKEGIDYDVLYEGSYGDSPITVYQPYTWEASRMIASSSVPPIGVTGEWCTAYQKENYYWRNHTFANDRSAFIYVCGDSVPTKKVAFEINDHLDENCDGRDFTFGDANLMFNVWDVEDYQYGYDFEGDDDFDELIMFVKVLKVIKKAMDNYPKIVDDRYTTDPKTGLVMFDGDLEITEEMVKGNRIALPHEIDILTGNLDIRHLSELYTLEGLPTRVLGKLLLEGLPKVSSLVGCPQRVGSIEIIELQELTSMEGFPQVVDNEVELYELHYVESLKGMCSDCTSLVLNSLYALKDLVGIPKSYEYDIKFLYNLQTLNGLTVQTVRKFIIQGCENLTSLEGCPSKVMADFTVDGCKNLKTIVGSPTQVEWARYYALDGVSDLTGCPSVIGRSLYFYNSSSLVSTKGIGQEIGDSLQFINCRSLRELVDLPSTIKGISVRDCMKLKSAEGIKNDLMWLSYDASKMPEFHNSLMSNPNGIGINEVRDGKTTTMLLKDPSLMEDYGIEVLSTFRLAYPSINPTREMVEKNYIGNFEHDIDCLIHMLEVEPKEITFRANEEDVSFVYLLSQYLIEEYRRLGKDEYSKHYSDDLLDLDMDTAMENVEKFLGEYITLDILKKYNKCFKARGILYREYDVVANGRVYIRRNPDMLYIHA